MKKLLILILILTPITSFADGYISVSPTHDFVQGNGAILSLDGDVHLHKQWYLIPEAQLSTVQKYRDANGKLDLEYRWTSLFSTSIGAGYDSYHYFGADRTEYKDIHTRFKFKIW